MAQRGSDSSPRAGACAAAEGDELRDAEGVWAAQPVGRLVSTPRNPAAALQAEIEGKIAARERLAPVPFEGVEATLYLRSAFNYQRIEVRGFRMRVGKHAQYQRALALEWLEKGKRKWKGVWLTYRPEAVILSGHGHPVPADAMEDRGGGVSVSRHSCFAEEWSTEFGAWLEKYLEQHPGVLLGDYRDFDTQGR